eukprot:TRINITY_DN108148_c0_g1_i1.p1 TRINITY_DN108148_c0_g1~~TRINITY_DN108148_c0_g1_i1.p1  ORF type:complete len:107 (+),score=7.41 TRINITY_DN108148_c0_g1_i1:547-867(+)
MKHVPFLQCYTSSLVTLDLCHFPMSDRLLCVVAPKCEWNSQNTKTPKKGTTPVSLCNGAILHFSSASQKGENQLKDKIVPVSSLSTVVTPSHVGRTTNDIKESNLW